MGQDIHMVIEGQMPDGVWIGLCNIDRLPALTTFADIGSDINAHPRVSFRNYLLWYYMCGAGTWPVSMRQEKFGLPLFDKRGWPIPVSDLTLLTLDSDEYHSHSWLTLEEFMVCWQLTWDAMVKDGHEQPKQWTVYDILGDMYRLRYYLKDHGAFRFVFAFDN